MSTLNGMKIAILVANGFEQAEMVKPRQALQDAGAQTYIISPEKTVQGWNHDQKADTFSVDLLLQEAKAQEFDALLLPGGVMNPDTLRTIPEAVAFAKQINEQKKPIAAICHGPWLLINAEAVRNKQITSWSSIKIDLTNAGAHWIDKPVVSDDNLVTSRKPDDIPQFNDAMIQLFQKLRA